MDYAQKYAQTVVYCIIIFSSVFFLKYFFDTFGNLTVSDYRICR